MIAIIRRALSDTFCGYTKPAFLGVVGFVITFCVLWRQRGWDAAMDEFGIWAASMLGAAGAVLLLFIWNLCCAPYRIKGDEVALLKAENETLRLMSNTVSTYQLTTDTLANVAAGAISAVRENGFSKYFEYRASSTTDELRRMAEFITRVHPVLGRIPKTDIEQVIAPDTHSFFVDDDGELFARHGWSENAVDYIDIRVPKDRVDEIVNSVIERCKAI